MTKIQAMELKGLRCVKCNCEFTNLKMAHFHHMRSYNKVGNISDMLNGRVNQATLKQELNKTVLLCAECHSKLHKDLGKKVFKKDTIKWLNA